MKKIELTIEEIEKEERVMEAKYVIEIADKTRKHERKIYDPVMQEYRDKEK